MPKTLSGPSFVHRMRNNGDREPVSGLFKELERAGGAAPG